MAVADRINRSQYRGKDAWKARSLRSTFGTQCLASLQTAPACGFGSSMREAGSKTYISPEADRALCKAQGGNNSQGPIYKVPAALGKQCLSTMTSAPNLGFGSSKRPGMARKAAAPGPGAYKLKPALGSQFESTKTSAAVVHFPGAHRDAAEKMFISLEHEKSGFGKESPGPSAYNVSGSFLRRTSSPSTLKGGSRFGDTSARIAAGLPGPGQYAVPTTVGRHPMSTKPNKPVVGFPKAHRDASRKMFISLDHEKSNYGVGSPGPATAAPPSGIGRPQLSTNRSMPAWGFGTARASARHDTTTPGPGEYFA
ncbi:g10170 [Coccomyxa elongata]